MDSGDRVEGEEVDGVENKICPSDDIWNIIGGEIGTDFLDVRFGIDFPNVVRESGRFVRADIVLIVKLAVEIVNVDGIAIGQDEFGESHADSANRERTSHAAAGDEESGVSDLFLNIRCDVFDIAEREEFVVRKFFLFHMDEMMNLPF